VDGTGDAALGVVKTVHSIGVLAFLLGVGAACGGDGGGGGGADGGGVVPLSVSIVSPLETVYTNGPVTVQLAVGGSVESVKLLVDGTALVTLPPPYQYTWSTVGVPEAPHALTAQAQRGAETVTSAPLTVVVDRTPPQVTERTPKSGAVNVGVHDVLRAVFSEPVLPSTINDATVTVNMGAVAIGHSSTLSADATALDIVLTAPPARPATVNVALYSDITDRAGNRLLTAGPWALSLPLWQLLGGSPLNTAPGKTAQNPRVVLDASDHPVVTWEEGGGGHTYGVARWNGTAWTYLPAGPMGTPTNVWTQSALALASNGDIFVSYLLDTHVHVARYHDAAWTDLPEVTTLDSSGFAAIVLDANDLPYLAYTEKTLVRVSHYDGKAWSYVGGALNHDINAPTVWRPSIALYQGRPIVSWREFGTGYRLYTKAWTPPSWVEIGPGALDTEPNGPGPNDADYGPLAVRGDSVAVAFTQVVDPHPYILVGQLVWGAWQFGNMLKSATGAAVQPSLAFARDGHPVVAWVEQTASSQQIRVSRNEQAAWTHWNGSLGVAPGVARFAPSLALDSHDTPIVAWDEWVGNYAYVYVARFNE
jgi:hypothetical protein